MLLRVQVPQMYPSLVVLVHKVLDAFGDLVYTRIRRRAAPSDPKTGRPMGHQSGPLHPKNVSEEAQEMCKNWLYKVASIRELGPRILVEMALWKCTTLLHDDAKLLAKDFGRFAAQIRGLGDPLVAAYARMYLSRKAMEVLPSRELLVPGVRGLIEDWVVSQEQWKQKKEEGKSQYRFGSWLKSTGIKKEDYIHLHSPVLNWLLAIYGYDASEADYKKMMALWKDRVGTAAFLNALLGSFEAEFVSGDVDQILKMIKAKEPSEIDFGITTKYHIYQTIGARLIEAPPKDSRSRRKILHEVWKDVGKMDEKQIKEYLAVVPVWLEFVCKHLTEREVSILLGDLRFHLGQNKAFEEHAESVKILLITLSEKFEAVEVLFRLDDFLPLLDMIPQEARIPMTVELLGTINRRTATLGAKISDPTVINTILDLARSLHDSLHLMSSEDDRRTYANICCAFIQKVEFGRELGDLEEHLNFLVECRRSFGPKLASIYEVCVLSALRLASIVATAYNTSSHSKKPAAFLKAALAYTHITVPSVPDIFARLQLFALAGSVALTHNFLPQADILLRSALNTLEQVPPQLRDDLKGTMKSTDEAFSSIVENLVNVFIVAPGHPDEGPLYLFEALFTVVKSHEYDTKAAVHFAPKPACLLAILRGLSAIGQERLPFHCPDGVRSNDELYAFNAEYQRMVKDLASEVFEELLDTMAGLADGVKGTGVPPVQIRRYVFASLELFNTILGFGDMTILRPVASKSWNLALQIATQGPQPVGLALFNNTLAALKTHKLSAYQQCIAKMNAPPSR
eukprot:NODE_223_length_2447_cov_13.752294_g174_i0.p1 GENE.NODE_223_length_2447_cov_13.752294_g174_i0~~NODE_223_length_2447_cov_13.752294_g174_i0.p1  ORF type:complete len:797 (-),score=259.87 NODE_223_length_2447_cov_13.752294_g174_i0:57-2447(-)